MDLYMNISSFGETSDFNFMWRNKRRPKQEIPKALSQATGVTANFIQRCVMQLTASLIKIQRRGKGFWGLKSNLLVMLLQKYDKDYVRYPNFPRKFRDSEELTMTIPKPR